MASIATEANGRRRVQFFAADGSRQTVRLGPVSIKQAQQVRGHVEALLAARITGHIDAPTASWLAGIDDRLHARLVKVGLVSPRISTTLAQWLETFIESRRPAMKPRALNALQGTCDKLLAHIGGETPMRSITPEHGTAWRDAIAATPSVRTIGLSRASLRSQCGNAKTILNAAVRAKVISENPFLHLASGATPSSYTRYITPDEIARMIDNSPTAEWKLLFGLARYAGLRVPSETHLLTLRDIDWERGRLTVRSPKTEHHAGHEQRLVPIVPKLAEILLARQEEMAGGESALVSITGQGGMALKIKRIAAAAGVDIWRRFWQTLRASCEKEWAMQFPQFAVSKWIGHSILVSGKHYANAVPDELFDRAAQNAAHRVASGSDVESCMSRPIGSSGQKPHPQPVRSGKDDSGDRTRTCDLGPKTLGNHPIPTEGGAGYGAAEFQLQTIIDVWPNLSAAVRARILAIIEAASPAGVGDSRSRQGP